MDQLQKQLAEERASHEAAVAEIAQLQNLVAELRREVRDLRVINQEQQERKRARGQDVENETVQVTETQILTDDQNGITKEKRDNEDEYCKIIGARLPNGPIKPEYVKDMKTVQKCANLLLEIREVDEILLREVPLWTTKYSNTINKIRKNALILLKYRFQIPNLPILHEISKHNYLLFKREKKDGKYELYAEAADKLEDSLLKSISKTAEVVKELGIICNK